MPVVRRGWPAVIMAVMLGLPGCVQNLPRDGLSQLTAPDPLAEPRGTYLELGRQYLQAGDLRRARDAFIRSIRVEGMSASALTGAGVTAEREGLLAQARTYFELARDRAPESVITHNNLGAVLYRAGAYNEAKQAFQAAFALSSGKSRIAHHNLGLTELALRELARSTVPMTSNPHPVRREGLGIYRLLTANDQKRNG